MAIAFSDDFNRANGPLDGSANWDGDFPGGNNGIQISANTVYLRPGGLYAGSCLVNTGAATLSSEQGASCTHTTVVAVTLAGPCVRCVQGTGTMSGYGAEVNSANIKLWKYTGWNYNGLSGAPSRIQLGSTYTATINNNDIVTIKAVGTTITVDVNGTTRITATDSTYNTGQPGVFVTSSGSSFQYIDDFEALELTPDSSGGSPLSVGLDGVWNRNMGHP